eukprot:g42602.t1
MAPHTKLPDFDEVDYQKKGENGNKRNTYADGTQTTCLLKKHVNDEGSDNSSTLDKHIASLSGHKRMLATKSKKKMNILAHAHHQDTYPNAASSWTVPYHLSVQAKYVKKGTFDPKAIRQWSTHSILEILQEKESVDLVGWFPEQTEQMPHRQNFPTSTKTLLSW